MTAKAWSERAGMTLEEWKAATKFDSTDWGWVIMSIGMAIGTGIVFLPVKVGIVGLWVFLVAAVIGYPVMYQFQKLYINTLASARECVSYVDVLTGYLGKNSAIIMGAMYFLILFHGLLVYPTAIINDSSAYLYTFGIIDTSLAGNAVYCLVVICVLVAIASRGEKVLFRVSSGMVIIKLSIVAILGLIMMPHWDLSNIGPIPPLGTFVKGTLSTLTIALTSILFIQSLSPMVISYRSHNKNIEVARYKALRAMNIAYGILFVTVFFYVISFTLAIGHDQAVMAQQQNISSLAMAARGMEGNTVKIISLILNIFAIMTAFFGLFMGFREACYGIVMNILRRFLREEQINKSLVTSGTILFGIVVAWGAAVLNFQLLFLITLFGPLVAMIGCFIPVYLVKKVPDLKMYDGFWLKCIFLIGVFLFLSPVAALLE